MKECEKCGNYIPRDVFTCPHCGVIGSGWPRMLLGIAVLVIAVFGFGICVYQWHRGINSAVLPFISALIAIPAGVWGAILFSRGKMAARAKSYKAHTNHDFTNSRYCKVCGKLSGHTWNCRISGHAWNGCKCRICGKTRNEGHEWEGCKCNLCGEIRHKWVDDALHCKCEKCGYEADHDWQESTWAWSNGTGGITSTCLRCGKTEER